MKSALIVTGGWDGHEPRKCGLIMADVLKKAGFDLVVADTLDAYLDA